MIKHFSKVLSTYLAENGGNPKQEKIYSYGIEYFLNESISDVILLFFGFLLHNPIHIIIWCISFTLIRLFLGGFHASTHARCILIGTIAGICSIYLNFIWDLRYPYPSIIITIFASIFSFLYAPIVHKNHPISNNIRKNARKNAICVIFLESIISITLHPYYPKVASSIMSGILTAFLMAIAAKHNPKM